MILTYHNVDLLPLDELTVGIFAFIKQMLKLRNYKVVYLEDYNIYDDTNVVITFDDGYSGFLKYALPVLKFFNYPFEVFICKNFLDTKNFIKTKDLYKIIESNGRLEYHSKSHYNLTEIKEINILEEEISPPEELKLYDENGFKYFSYPYWKYSLSVINIIKKYYNGARSGNGFADNTIWALDSIKMNNKTKIEGKK